MLLVSHIGSIKCLTALLKIKAAGFQKIDPDVSFRKSHGKNQPRNTAPHHADSGVERLASRRLFEVDMHVVIISRNM
jgi:hypothetical protein